MAMRQNERMVAALRKHDDADRPELIDTLRECRGCVRFLPRDHTWSVLARLDLIREGG
eukprot:COSAG01_NODE_144_length_24108_cov_11.490441_23_plen_58_part_00